MAEKDVNDGQQRADDDEEPDSLHKECTPIVHSSVYLSTYCCRGCPRRSK